VVFPVAFSGSVHTVHRITVAKGSSVKIKFIVMLASAVMGLAPCAAFSQIKINGAGATFPDPLYQRMNAEYRKIATDVEVDYNGIGSGGGIKSITDKTVDFAASDAPLGKGEIAKTGGAANLIEFPSCAGAVVPAFNLPGVSDLKFSGAVLSQIYMGKIIKWNDPEIAKLNPGVVLPDLVITPVYRTDGSGTNFVWTHYLCDVSPAFKEAIGSGKQVKWPLGQGGKGTAGVAAVVQQTSGAIGYIEQNYADKNKISFGSVQNKAGKFIKASPASVSAAGASAATLLTGNQLQADIWNQEGDSTYPIASFTYLIVYKDLNNLKSRQQAQALVDYLWWATHDGQTFATDLDYAPLAPAVAEKVSQLLQTMTYGGQAVTPVHPK
jgi:phosphate transport system substrate-binding protein